MVNKNEEYDNLVREIFYRRKKEEICGFFMNIIKTIVYFIRNIRIPLTAIFCIALCTIIPYLIGAFLMNLPGFSLFVAQLKEANPGMGYKYAFIFVSWAIGMLFMMIIALIAIIVSSIHEWLDNNWEASEQEAKQIMKNKKGKKK